MMMYFYISIFFYHNVFSNSDDIKNDSTTKSTNVKSEFKLNLLEYYFRNNHRTQSLLVDCSGHETNSEFQSLVEESAKNKLNEYIGRTRYSDINHDIPISYDHQYYRPDFEDVRYINDQISNSEVNDDGRIAVSQNGVETINKSIIGDFISNPLTRDRNYKIDTRSYSYETITDLFTLAFWISKSEKNCSLSDLNKSPLKARALNLINIVGLTNYTSINDTISFFKLYTDIYETLPPCKFDGILYQTSIDCLVIEFSQEALIEYFEKNSGLVTFEYLVGKVKCICKNIVDYMTYQISYGKLTYPNELLELIEKMKKKISDKNDPIHQSSNPISEFCGKIISNSIIANFIKNNNIAIEYILCKIRNIFNVQDAKNKDYLAGADILNSLIKSTPKTANIINSTILTSKSVSQQSTNENHNSSAKLTSLQIGLICGGVIVGVLILVVVSTYIYKKKFRK